MGLYELLLDCQKDVISQSSCVKVRLFGNTWTKYVYIPYILYKSIFKNQYNFNITTELYFDYDIDGGSFISYVCDIIQEKKILNLTYCDKENVEKYIISKSDIMKEYMSYNYPDSLSPDEFGIFNNMLSEYGDYGMMIMKGYCILEIPTNLYIIDRIYNLPEHYFTEKKICIRSDKKYNIKSLSKYKFVHFNEKNSPEIKYCFSIKIVNGIIYMKGPFKTDDYVQYYEAAWINISTTNEYIEQKDIQAASLIVQYGGKIKWCDSYEYIIDMQNDDIYKNNSIKLKIQDDISNDIILYIPKKILYAIDEEYFKLVTDMDYMKNFGDSNPSIYFSGNQTNRGFLEFLEQYLNYLDMCEYASSMIFTIFVRSIDNINLYTYFHRFNKHHILRLKLAISMAEFEKIMQDHGFDNNSQIYELICNNINNNI